MTKKPANTANAAEKLKQGVKKLFNKAKKSSKLAAALPVAAIVVNEVHAAQIESLPDFDLAGLDPLAKPEQPQELALDDLDQQQFVSAAEDEVVQSLSEVGANANAGDLLLAQAETSGTAASSVATDAGVASGSGAGAGAGAGVSASSVAAAAVETFELSSLPLVGAVGGPLGVFAATVAGVVAATDTATPDAAATEVTRNDIDGGSGTHLSTSLSDLTAQGVDSVNASSSLLHVQAGNVAQINTTNMPLFGDVNKDGVLTAAEDAALDVTLDLASVDQLTSLSGLSGLSNLSAAGVDKVQFNLADQAALDAFVGNSNLTAELLSLSNAGLSISGINMAGNETYQLTAAQHQVLTDAGVQFASDDHFSVDGTQLQTSVQDLQDLAVQSDSPSVEPTAVSTESLSVGGAEASFSAMSEEDINMLVSTISDLGFADVSALTGGASVVSTGDNVPQTLVNTTIETIGVDEAQALLDVFGSDILDKKIV